MKETDLMMQSLLADRFQLKAHFETHEMPVYQLVLAKGGPKFKESPADEPIRKSQFPGGGVVVPEGEMRQFYQAPMTLLASLLTNRNLAGPGLLAHVIGSKFADYVGLRVML